ncbi:MAG: putative bifunctional diguanylate cyclase/phosphodiesterase [Alphaproteobacteria bacterium]
MTPEFDTPFDWMVRFVGDIPAAVALFDRDLRYVAASKAWLGAFGLPRTALAGRRHNELCKAGRDALEEVQWHALNGDAVEDYHPVGNDAATRLRPAIFSARPSLDPDGDIAGVIVGLREDVAPDARERVPARDPLTGLADRHQFARRLGEVLADPDPERRAAVVFAINLDSFRSLNTLHGFATGDRVLKIIAERLVAGTRSRDSGQPGVAARGKDMVARLGADEFGIICSPPAFGLGEAEAFAARLPRIVQSPIAIGALSLRLTARVGFITTTPAHRDADDALRDLDLALRQAKVLGPSKVLAWEPALTRAAVWRYSLAEQLSRAFDNGEFILHYQPILQLSDNKLVGAEALLRWNHPSEGLVPSAAFLPLLEETALIVEVGCWVIREAIGQIESWRLIYGRDIVDWVSVNLSKRQLDDPSALLATLRAVRNGGFAVHRLKLEISETAFTRNPETTRTVLAEMEELGVQIAIDDFGAGYSELHSLRHYPVDTVKIDAECIAQIGTAEGEQRAQTLLDIARSCDAAIIAEGIVTAAQRDFLCASGCGFGQGYLFAEPMDGALLGAYALTHAAHAGRAPARKRPGLEPITRPTSRDPSPAG